MAKGAGSQLAIQRVLGEEERFRYASTVVHVCQSEKRTREVALERGDEE